MRDMLMKGNGRIIVDLGVRKNSVSLLGNSFYILSYGRSDNIVPNSKYGKILLLEFKYSKGSNQNERRLVIVYQISSTEKFRF